MPVTRERVDPQRDHDALGLVHRRWIVPDDVQRPMPLQVLARLWRGLIELRVLDGESEVRLVRFNGEALELPAAASAGALLAGAGTASLVTQVVWTDDEGRRDPYAEGGEPDPEGFRDYTLYAVDVPGRVLLPIAPVARLCASCGRRVEIDLPRFGEGVLLDLDQPVCTCAAKADLARDLLPGCPQHRASPGATKRRAPGCAGRRADPRDVRRYRRAFRRLRRSRGVIRAPDGANLA